MLYYEHESLFSRFTAKSATNYRCRCQSRRGSRNLRRLGGDHQTLPQTATREWPRRAKEDSRSACCKRSSVAGPFACPIGGPSRPAARRPLSSVQSHARHPGQLTRVGFLSRLLPFALAHTTGRLPFAPLHPLPLALFEPLLLLCARLGARGRKVLGPRLRPQGRLRPCLCQPHGSDQTQASAREATELASAWSLRPAARRLARHMPRRQLVQVAGWLADLRLRADPHHPQGTDRQR